MIATYVTFGKGTKRLCKQGGKQIYLIKDMCTQRKAKRRDANFCAIFWTFCVWVFGIDVGVPLIVWNMYANSCLFRLTFRLRWFAFWPRASLCSLLFTLCSLLFTLYSNLPWDARDLQIRTYTIRTSVLLRTFIRIFKGARLFKPQ